MEKTFFINNEEVKISNITKNTSELQFEFNGRLYHYTIQPNGFVFSNGKKIMAKNSGSGEILYKDMIHKVEKEDRSRRKRGAANDAGSMLSPMPGKIFKILSEVGAEVKKGETILILEAMKMEHSVKASDDGVIDKIFFQEGELVDGGVPLVSLKDS